jgi:hypothetical protein
VLENDAEFARWKINRRNMLRIERVRRTQDQLAASLEAMRSKAKADIGPAAVEPVKLASAAVDPLAPAVRSTSPAPSQGAPANNNAPARRQSRDLDTGRGGGGGAIDPISGAIVLALGALAAASLRRRAA